MSRVEIASLGVSPWVSATPGGPLMVRPNVTIVVTDSNGNTITPYTASTGGSTAACVADTYGVPSGWLDGPQRVTFSEGGITHTVDVVPSDAVAGPAASGDTTGATDTTAINTALAALTAGQRLVLRAGATYWIKTSGTSITFGSGGTIPVGLKILSGTGLDPNGATLKLATGQAITMICNAGAAGTSDTDITLGAGIFDGNGVDIGSTGLVRFHGVTRLTVDGRVQNTQCTGFELTGCSKIRSRSLEAESVQGIGIYLGSPSYPCTSGTFGTLTGRSVTAWADNTFNFPGNGVYIASTNLTIDTIAQDACAGGVKIDGSGVTEHVAVGKVLVSGCTTTNSGLKLQGDGSYPRRVTIGQLIARDNTGEGLYDDTSVDCSIGSYVGFNNGTSGTNPDVRLGGTRTVIGSLTSNSPCVTGLTVRSTASGVRVGPVTVYNPNTLNVATTSAVSVIALPGSGGSGRIHSVNAIDDRGGSAKMYRGLDVSSSTFALNVGALQSAGHTNAAYNISGSTVRAQNVGVSGSTTYAQIALTAEPTVPVGASFGQLAKTGEYIGADVTNISSSPKPGNNVPFALQRVLAASTAISAIGVNVSVIGDVGSVVQLCIWNDDGTGRPGTLLLAAGTIAGDATGYQELAVTLTLAAGRYWLGGISQLASTTQPQMYGTTGFAFPGVGATTGANATTITYAGMTGATQSGSPAAFASAAAAGSIPRVVVKVA